MKELLTPNLYVALTHYPVANKHGETIASAVTNLDLHDISRLAKTYGIRSFFVITPLTDQQSLVHRIVSHWTDGAGADYNPNRRQALNLIDIRDTIESVINHLQGKHGQRPKLVVTCARDTGQSIGYDTFRHMLRGEETYLLVFGTAWGLTTSFIDQADVVLDPIRGQTDYNHLSVRSAASIVLDRLFGR